MIHLRILTLVFLGFFIATQSESLVNDGDTFYMEEMKLPVLTTHKLTIKDNSLDALFKKLVNRRVIWVVGEFKVGKTFIIDMITNAKSPKSSEFFNTIGLNVYINEPFAIIDTEGMNQPAGTNNPYFVKEFIMNFMALTADEIVIVGDQVKITDMEVYYRVAQIYYSNKNISHMFYIHNCKTLDATKLDLYKERAKTLFNLNGRYTDRTKRNKPIVHKFYPKITRPEGVTNLAEYILSLGGGFIAVLTNLFGLTTKVDKLEDLLHNEQVKREEFTPDAYAEAVDQSLRYLGYKIGKQDKNEIELENIQAFKVDFIPAQVVYCQEDNQHLVLQLRTGEVQSISRVDAITIKIVYQAYAVDYRRFNREQLIHLPEKSLSPSQKPWKLYRHPDGIMILIFSIPEGEINSLNKCHNLEYGTELDSKLIVDSDKKAGGIIEMVMKILNFLKENSKTKEL